MQNQTLGSSPMLALGFVALMLAVTPVVFVACSQISPTEPDSSIDAELTEFTVKAGNSQGGVCPDGYFDKIEAPGPHTYSTSSISSVCVKAGRGNILVSCGDSDPSGCYTIDWTIVTGTCVAVQVTGGGTSSTCKEISHTAAYEGPPPSPSPTPTPTPTPSPTPDPS